MSHNTNRLIIPASINFTLLAPVHRLAFADRHTDNKFFVAEIAMKVLVLIVLLFHVTRTDNAVPHSTSLETQPGEHVRVAEFLHSCIRSSGKQFQDFLEEGNKCLVALEDNSRAVESEVVHIAGGKAPYSYNATVRTMLVMCGLLSVAAVLGSIVDVALRLSSNGLSSSLLNFITAFSLLKNLHAITTTQQPASTISSLNGIRVMSMFWIILFHVHIWCSELNQVSNQVALERDIFPRLWYQVILNGFFSVDSLFLLSGTVAAYNNLRAMDSRQNHSVRFPLFNYYVHRYLRLTLVYAFVVFSRHHIVHLLDTWPIQLLTSSVNQSFKNCDQYWWTNLLYINNIYPWRMRDECLFWTWSMANDMQFYVIAPIVLLPLYHSFRKGITVAGTLLTISFIATGAIAGINDFSPVSGLQPFTSDAKEQTDEIYIKPYCRVPPYLVGSILGYVLHNRVQLPFHGVKKYLCYVTMWSLAMITFTAIIFGLYSTWYGYHMSMMENILFYTYTHFAWGVGVAIMVFACQNGYGWIINDFLSMKIWIPLSRLTYNVSLIHPIILDVILGSAGRISVHWDVNLVMYTAEAIVLSYGAAAVLAAFVEYPFSNLEMLIFKIIGIRQEESMRLVSLATKENKYTNEKKNK